MTDRRHPRRAFLAGAGAALAGLWLPGAPAAVPMRRWVDVHHHFIPPGYAEFFQSARSPDGKPAVVPPTNWDLALDMEDMDRSGTATAMLSMFVPPQLGTPASRAQLARSINEHAARLRDEHPGRFGMFAALPLPDVAASLRELAHAGDHHALPHRAIPGGHFRRDRAGHPHRRSAGIVRTEATGV